MADELRIPAEIIDKFSGPLKAFKAELLGAGKHGAEQTEVMAKGFAKVEAGMQATARVASTVVNPALTALGVTGLGAGAAIMGIQGALSKLTGNLVALGQLSRETGIAAQALQNFSGVASRFGVEQGAIDSAARTFSQNMREIGRHTGEVFQWLNRQGTNPASRKAFQDFASDLERTKDQGEALRKSLEFMETIKDPRERSIFSRNLFGSDDIGKLGDGHLGKIGDLLKKQQEKVGPLDPKSILDAEKFDKAANDLKSSMQKVGIAIAKELLGPAREFTTWIDEIVSGQRKEFTAGLTKGIADIKAALLEINWKQFGDDAKTFLESSTALAGKLADSIRAIASAIRAYNEGKYVEVFRHLDGASGPLARKFAPLPGDDQVAAKEARDVRAAEIEKRQAEIQARLGQGELNRGTVLGDRAREQSDKLRREMEKLTDELRQLRATSGATVSKSSAEGDGLFGGARVQTAAFGGFGGSGFGFGPGWRGGRPGPMPVPESYRGVGEPRLYGGPGGGGGGAPGGGAPPVPRGPMLDPGSRTGRAMRELGGGGASVARGDLAANQQEAYAAARAEGLSDTAARALVANMSGESLRNPRDHHWDRKHMSQGIVQWDPQRAEAIRRKFGAYPKDMSVTDQTRAAIDEIKTNPRFRRTARELEGDDPNSMLRALVENYEVPQDTGRAIAERQRFYRGFSPNGSKATGTDPDFFPNGAPRILRPNSMGGAPGMTMEEADRRRSALKDAADSIKRRRAEILADAGDERRRPGLDDDEVERRAIRDAGIAFRSIHRQQAAETARLRASSDRVNAAAARAGIVGGPQYGESNVSVVVNRAGPDATARVSTDGPVFKDAKIQSARPMRKAGD